MTQANGIQNVVSIAQNYTLFLFVDMTDGLCDSGIVSHVFQPGTTGTDRYPETKEVYRGAIELHTVQMLVDPVILGN